MEGQWIGEYLSDHKGFIILNLDKIDDHYQGFCFVNPETLDIPKTCFPVMIKPNEKSFHLSVNKIVPINPLTYKAASWSEIKAFYQTASIANKIDIDATFSENEMDITASTENVTAVSCHLTKEPYQELSSMTAQQKTWEEYKDKFHDIKRGSLLFRGQSKPWTLRTAFHRRKRYDLVRFMERDIPLLLQQLSSRINHIFNLKDENELGAFLNLIQHYGYPTPLLDWTLSPYVAAYFAFSNVRKDSLEEGFARIFVLDAEKWKADWKEVNIVDSPILNLTIKSLLSIENPRMVPQQAVCSISSVDDIEKYIQRYKKMKNCIYLNAIDIKKAERNKIMKELTIMGITAGSLFPGIQGVCEEYRELLFEH
jgi:hypothetical protein